MSSAAHMPSPPPSTPRVKYPFSVVTLIWIYLTLPSLPMKALCTRLLILDFNRSCGIEVQSVEKPNAWTDVAAQTSSRPSDDNKPAELPRIHMLLTPLWLVLVLQYLTNPSFMAHSTLVRRHDRPPAAHSLELDTNRCLCYDLRSLGVQYRYGRFWPSSDISSPTDATNRPPPPTTASNESSIWIYVGLLMFTLFIPNPPTRVSI